MRTEAQKEARRRYESSDKGKAARKRHEATYVLSGKRAIVEARRSAKETSKPRVEAKKRWAKLNRDYYTADRSLRRSLERNLSDFDRFVLIEAVSLARLRSAVTGIKWHVDHIIPVSKGGNAIASNLQVVPGRWNQSKGIRETRFFN